MPLKSPFCIGSSLSSACLRCASVSARIISRTAAMRSAAKNMCSVRVRPMPSAPYLTATAASCGVSAFVRTLSLRIESAHSIKVAKSPETSASIVGIAPA